MAYNRYFWKSGRNQRERTPEERRNLRKIVIAAVLAVLAGLGVGAVIILSYNVR